MVIVYSADINWSVAFYRAIASNYHFVSCIREKITTGSCHLKEFFAASLADSVTKDLPVITGRFFKSRSSFQNDSSNQVHSKHFAGHRDLHSE